MNKNITVLLTCSGIGSRLGSITKYTNKALVKIGKKPAIGYIIESYPKDAEFVITLGHYGSHVKQYLEMVYSDRNFKFIEVKNYSGQGSSPVLSQLCAKELLNKPFFYHSCDTITFDNSYINECLKTNKNVLIGYKTNSGQYDSFDMLPTRFNFDAYPKSIITNLYSKGESTNANLSYVGISYVYDYKTYWRCLEQANIDYNYLSPSDFCVYKNYGIELYGYEINSWYDVGNIESLNIARNKFPDAFNILYKEKESIFIQDIDNKKYIIKFFADKNRVNNLVKRAESIKDYVAPIYKSSDNFLIYEYTEGDVLSNHLVPTHVNNLLHTIGDSMWSYTYSNIDTHKYKNEAIEFYITKTTNRINDLVEKYDIDLNKPVVINNFKDKPLYKTPNQIIKKAFDIINNKINTYVYPTKWHGDFIPDNIIRVTPYEYKLIDWRESFCGNTEYGDKYYDLAKLNHNLTVNHKIIYDNLFNVEINKNSEYDDVYVNILTNYTMEEAKSCIEDFVKNGTPSLSFEYNDYAYVELLTGIVWLNMSPLHHNPFDLFLFYFGLHKLQTVLAKYYNI